MLTIQERDTINNSFAFLACAENAVAQTVARKLYNSIGANKACALIQAMYDSDTITERQANLLIDCMNDIRKDNQLLPLMHVA